MVIEWQKIQEKWQKKWENLGSVSINKNKQKFFMIFAYPGVSGYLHVGHLRGFSYTDAICRYQRLLGKQVLFSVGTHASGNQAITFARKVKKRDKAWLEYLEKNGFPMDKIGQLEDPKKVVDYFNRVYVNDYWKKFGFICDWDRFTSTINPDYQKFIQWQFLKLNQKGLLVKNPYFATFCPKCGPVAVDPSETDISKGGNAEKQEYVLLKFKMGDFFLVAATLRPETIYGQTNLWINPDAEYVKVKVKNEIWIMSSQAAQKISYQKNDTQVLEKIDPKKLIGKKVVAPGIEKEIIILPAPFSDPDIGSGIVTCVPSDAPYDYVALTELQNNKEQLKKFGLGHHEIKNIKPIPIIKSKGFGDFPAKEIVEKNKIKNQNDPKLEELTKAIYKAGFHSGVMRENTGKYAGKKVAEKKEIMKAELLEQGKADLFFDLSEEVICRCGEKVVIKKIDDQWFIKYSDNQLTKKTIEHAESMNIFPKEYQKNLPTILDWFGDRACARLGTWIGTKLPWDKKWTVEPISDSTLYPLFYVVSKFVNSNKIKTDDLSEQFFDYVFFGTGKPKSSWKKVREEVEYFYPLDINLGGKEHQTVHFPVFLMNHVAVLPQNMWPKGIFVNWWVTGKGSKISKSKGGAEPIPDAIKKFGVDAMRLYYAHIGSPHIDVVWDEPVVFHYKTALEKIHKTFMDFSKNKTGQKQEALIDRWLVSRLQHHIKDCQKAMEKYDLRELANIAYFSMIEDLKWYNRRGGKNREKTDSYFKAWSVLMNPITPHLSEEINTEKGLVSSSEWPIHDESLIDLESEANEDFVKNSLNSARNVLKLARLEKPKTITFFVAQSWLYEIFSILSKELQVTRNIGEIMKKVLAVEELKIRGKEVSKIVQSLSRDPSRIPQIITSQDQELKVLKESEGLLKNEFGCEIEIVSANKTQHPKSKNAMPGRPGILAE